MKELIMFDNYITEICEKFDDYTKREITNTFMYENLHSCLVDALDYLSNELREKVTMIRLSAIRRLKDSILAKTSNQYQLEIKEYEKKERKSGASQKKGTKVNTTLECDHIGFDR